MNLSSSSKFHGASVSHILSFLFIVFFVFKGSSKGNFKFVNNCGYTVWPGIYGPRFPSTGFMLPMGKSSSLQAPTGWAGQVWGRTGCYFNGTGHGSCAVGDCAGGKLECNGYGPTMPVTIAWFTRNQTVDLDEYYVSLINGYNLPMTVEAKGGAGPETRSCSKTGCVDDLNLRCPPELTLRGGGGCMSACQAFGSPEYCCSSSFSSATACKPTAYAQLFKSACPRSYSTAYDDAEGATFSCKDADYIVTFCPPADAFSTIRTGGQLDSNDQLVSIRGNFTLGFFGTDYGFLGIWYTSDVRSRKVWMANPNEPIVSDSGTHALSIDTKTGNLIITAQGRTLMKLTDVQAGPNPNLTATLESTGNCRLVNEIDKRVLWQSFDHPTNVLLPGMKLGSSKTAARNWTLTSLLSDEVPGSGAFSLSWEPDGETSQRLMIRRRGNPYWTSGSLTNQTFQYMFALNGPDSQSYYIFSYEYDENERYFSYHTSCSCNGGGGEPMWILTPKGQIADGNSSDVWTPEFCYGYDSGNGCVANSSLPQCRGVDDEFSETNGDFAPNTTTVTRNDSSSLSISDCFLGCWDNCGCVAFTNGTYGTGCIVWTGSNSFQVNRRGNSSLKYVISSQNQSTGKRAIKSRNWIWVVVGVVASLLFLGSGILCYTRYRKRRRQEEIRKRDKDFLELTASESFKDIYQLETDGRQGNNVLIFSFASIVAATDDFSVENKLGQGGFGPVYKGRLSDGREIAIKRLSRTSGQGLVEFKNELILIAKLQHTNLVRVLGCCIYREEKMLVYEYMPNKSLNFFIFDENRKAELDWPKRFNIIEGIAQGLLYLHKYSRMRVIHRDLKANNVLLDEHMNPKISDFGMARIFKQNETEAMTSRVVGTYGYMSPEYAMHGTFSFKSDVFSFGVLILEIVSGRRNSSFVHHERTFNLIGYAWELWKQGDALELKDPTLRDTCVDHQWLRTVHVALLCVQESPADRPTTSDMISMLLNDTMLLPTPNKPAFVIDKVGSKSTLVESKPEECSVNNLTITTMEAR